MNVPERIWVENLNNNYKHLSNCSLTNPEADPQDHRIMDEYILKAEIDFILKPIRDVKKKMCPTVQAKWNWDNLYRELTEAITETLRRMDK